MIVTVPPAGTAAAGQPMPPSVPATSHLPAPPAPSLPPGPVEFPLRWLLDHASLPIQYRALVDVARVPGAERLAWMPFASPSALLLAVQQRSDGTWNQAMLTLPPARAEHFEGVGTIHAFRRLLEYGFDRESPPLVRSRRILFRLLAEDDDPSLLYELAPRGRPDPEVTHWGRTILREAAAAALAQAGYEGDPRLRGAARRILERVTAFVRGPAAQKPFVRAGNQHVLAPDAMPPSIYTLLMLAHMPLFRNEQYDSIEAIYQYVSQPLPRQEPVMLVAKRQVAAPHLVLGDMLPHRNAADEDVPWALTWLELMARLGFLRRNEGWLRLFDRFLEDRDAQGIWHPHKGTAVVRSTNPLTWAGYPLESHVAGDVRWTDVTFRLGLIARLLGRTVEVA
ncbi:MAG TPA: hypothetical protein VNA89_10565 [Gemmatimonadaceae bacterium]|nr:hypothetical protein [Gemmatimonadaceae bacterium]